ncbi:unnamed protein product [Rotaria socialis]
MKAESLGISLTPNVEGKLEDEFFFEFSTTTPTVLEFLPTGEVSTLKPTFFLLFDQKIDKSEIFKHLCVVSGNEHKMSTKKLKLVDETTAKSEFKLFINEKEENHEQYIAFTFKDDLLKATQYTIQALNIHKTMIEKYSWSNTTT